jgi:phosphoribosyl-dephospho-CoA transferase
VLRPDSDLDIRIDAREPLDAATKQGLADLVRRAGCRLDIQIDTGSGGFGLGEWLADRGRVLLKTNRGPVMVSDPWTAPPDGPVPGWAQA